MKVENSTAPKRVKICGNRVVSQVIDDEAIIINMETGCYYSLDKIGADIWNHIEQCSTVAEIVDMLEARYDCASDDVIPHVEKLLAELEFEQLIEQVSGEHETNVHRVRDQHDSKQERTLVSFEIPKFEKHSDMRDFLLVDPIHKVDDRGWPHKNNG